MCTGYCSQCWAWGHNVLEFPVPDPDKFNLLNPMQCQGQPTLAVSCQNSFCLSICLQVTYCLLFQPGALPLTDGNSRPLPWRHRVMRLSSPNLRQPWVSRCSGMFLFLYFEREQNLFQNHPFKNKQNCFWFFLLQKKTKVKILKCYLATHVFTL